MSLKFPIWLKVLCLALTLAAVALATYTYVGRYLWEESSPDGQYTLRYYRTFNPFLVPWFRYGTPGDSPCKAIWIRLYNQQQQKLNEYYTDDCQIERDPRWYGDELVLPNLKVWKLPNPVTKDTDY